MGRGWTRPRVDNHFALSGACQQVPCPQGTPPGSKRMLTCFFLPGSLLLPHQCQVT